MPSKALFLGTVCHDSLDRFHLVAADLLPKNRPAYMEKCLQETWKMELERLRGLLTPAELNDAAVQISDVFDKAEGILQNHISWAETNIFPRYAIETTEQDFVIPFMEKEGLAFAGKYDVIARHRQTGQYWLIDYKISAAGAEWYTQYLQSLDDQAKAYSWAGRELYGDAFGGIAFIIVRSKPPSIPKVLKDGTLSRAMNQDTTWPIFKAQLDKIGMRQEAYHDVRANLEAREKTKPFNTMVMMKFPDETLDLFEASLKHVVREMMNPVIYPNPSFMTCHMCSFREPCELTMRYGSDNPIVLRSLAEKFVVGRYVQDARELLEMTSYDNNG